MEGKAGIVLAVTIKKNHKQMVVFLPACLYRCIIQISLNPLLNLRLKKIMSPVTLAQETIKFNIWKSGPRDTDTFEKSDKLSALIIHLDPNED